MPEPFLERNIAFEGIYSLHFFLYYQREINEILGFHLDLLDSVNSGYEEKRGKY